MTTLERAEEAEHALSQELDRLVIVNMWRTVMWPTRYL